MSGEAGMVMLGGLRSTLWMIISDGMCMVMCAGWMDGMLMRMRQVRDRGEEGGAGL